MPTAIRHKKSRPAWLALIAMAAAGATIVVTLATVVISSVVQTRRTAEQATAVALTARPEGRTGVRVTVPAAAQESPDALAARAEAGSKAAAQVESGSATDSIRAGSVNPGLATTLSPATPAATSAVAPAVTPPTADTPDQPPALQAIARVEKTTPTATATVTGDADAHPATPKHRYLPSRASGHAGSRRAGGPSAASAARNDGSLRADITRYNAERGAGTARGHALTLRAASVPGTRSLWDEVPRPLSELYRN